MSDTAAQPWWADVQHLRPREDGGTRRREDLESPASATPIRRATGRFTRTEAATSPLETAVAVAITDDLPRLDDIDWHEFVEGHTESVDASGAALPYASSSTEALDGLDWDAPKVWDDEPQRDPVTGRRTVEIKGQVGGAATATVDDPVSYSTARRHAPRTAGERFHARPDRVALWAFLLGVILMLVAALSAPEADAAVRLLGA